MISIIINYNICVIPLGTTGPPKGVELTHSNINTNLLQVTQEGYLLTRPFEGGTEQNRFIGILPFFHIYGFVLVMAKTIYQGSHTVTLPKFEPPVFIECLRKHKVFKGIHYLTLFNCVTMYAYDFKPTFLHLVPPLISFVGSHPEITSKELEHTIGVMGGAAP